MCGISCIVAFREHTKKPVRLSSFQSSVTSKDVATLAHGSALHNPFGDIPPHSIQRDDVQQALDASLDEIQHRGPDSRGHWISDDNRVGMLAIPSSNQ
jgi:asparagine synthase (glutamine-hydrolysing)